MTSRRLARSSVPIAFVYFGALAVLACGDALFSPHAVISAPDMDIDRYFYSIRSFTFNRIRAGEFPLWNPFTFGGMPTLGDFQYAMLYPPNWLHVVLPVGLAIDVMVTLHLALAGFFTSVWCRWRGAGIVASLIGGTSFLFSGPLMTRLYGGHLTFLCVVAWAPLVMLCVDAILEGRRAAPAALVGAAAVAMQVLAGYPQPVHNTFLVVALYAALRLIRVEGRWRAAGSIAGMYALGLALAAAQLLPGIDAAREFVRGGDDLPAEFSMSFSLPPENLVTFLVPHLFGDDFNAPYLGRWAVWEMSLYVGAIGATLALIAFIFRGMWRNRALAITSLVVILLALGQYTPLYAALMTFVPGLEQFRGPARIGFLATLLIAVLAAHGFDALWQLKTRALLRVASLAAVVAVVIFGAALIIRWSDALWNNVLLWFTRTGQQWPNVIASYDDALVERSARWASGQLLWTGMSLVELAIVIALASRRRTFAYVLPVLVVGQMWVASEPFRQKFQPYTRVPSEWRGALSERRSDDRVLVRDERWLNLPAQLGIESISGYDPSLSRRWANLVAPLVGADPLLGTIGGEPLPASRQSPIWDILRLRTTLPPGESRSAQPLPRLYLIEEVRVVEGADESLAAVRHPSFDPRRVVVLEAEPAVRPMPGGSGPPGEIVGSLVRDDSITAAINLERPATLLITDAYARGWRARPLQSGPQPGYEVLPANHALRGIPLAAGRHHLAVEYRPQSIGIGFIISAISLLGWIAAALWVMRSSFTPTFAAASHACSATPCVSAPGSSSAPPSG